MTQTLFAKLLVANRGEIACRVMRTAQQMGIGTVAIYAPADSNALHVKMADEAWSLDSDLLADSYLNIGQIIAIAQKSGATAIHPGYGFLSENSDFAQACTEAGLVFVGPSANTIAIMAQKDAAKQLMQQHGVPVIPGFVIDHYTDINKAAQEAGLPLLIKAVGGGGGKGMRLVDDMSQLSSQISQAQQEAMQSFGTDGVLCERYLPNARHIEVQIFFDNAGNGVYMFERDCSLQRRYQKVIEFAPANISDNLRHKMGQAALAAGTAVGYSGAGTVEFLLADDASDEFFFLEMNTRLQVEHPVTEVMIDEDLVAWQLQVAAGLPLPKSQPDLRIHRHAMELRLYAENPRNDFAPSSGTINHLSLPTNWRVDHGIEAGQEITNRYDPMLGKLIVAGDSYAQCIQQAQQAMRQCFVGGVHTNIAFLIAILQTDAVRTNTLGVRTLENLHLVPPTEANLALLACLLHLLNQQGDQACWRQWPTGSTTKIFFDQQSRSLRHLSIAKQGSSYLVQCDEGQVHQAQLQKIKALNATAWELHWLHNNRQLVAHIVWDASVWHVLLNGNNYQFRPPLAADFAHLLAKGGEHDTQIVAPMPGIIHSINAASGDQLAGQETLMVIEAMKVLTHLSVPVTARISDIYVSVGQNVSEGQLLAQWEKVDA